MSLLTTFSRKAPNRVFASIVLGALAGFCYAMLIPLVLSSISTEDPRFSRLADKVELVLGIEVSNYQLAGLFMGTCLCILVMRSLSEIILLRVASEVAKELRMMFYQRIASAPLVAVEQIGSSKFITSITIDVPRIISGAQVLPMLMINSITIVGMLGFLMYLNWDVFKLTMVAILIGVVLYQGPMYIASRIFQKTRLVQDQLQEGIRGLIFGAKELKLDTKKRQVFFKDVLTAHENSILRNDKKSRTIMRATTSFGDLISFFVIGAVAFVFVNYYAITSDQLVGVIMALLYITGPIAVLLGAIPTLSIAGISYRKLDKVLKSIPTEEVTPNLHEVKPWNTLSFKQVQYSYPSVGDEEGFHVGPLDLQISKGELTFIVGANGSGKSTLSKLLTLHYKPSKGSLYFDDTKVDADNIASYRQLISAIYSNYYLFDRLLIDLTDELEQTAQEYLVKFGLSEKVTIVDGQFSTLALSDGQRKRLALLVAFLEDKQVYLFDEWAADQDPQFKNVFYSEILPELKAKGKIVIIISHDDRYFYIADHILVMEQGVLTKQKSPIPIDTQSVQTGEDTSVNQAN